MQPQKLLALYTFGVFIKPAQHSDNNGFHELNDRIFPLVDNAAGFVRRSGYHDEPGPVSWGEQVFPRFYDEKGDGWSPSTLSLWRDIEAAMAFSYFGLHAVALNRGHGWFVKPYWPPYAVWWVGCDHSPSWAEAVQRHEELHKTGPTASAFNFKKPFNANGAPISADRSRIAAYVKQNAANSSDRQPLK